MPVSNPSYFPPESGSDQIRGINAGINSTGAPLFLGGQAAGNNSTVNSLIIIGHESGSAGPITDPDLAGTIIIGHNSGRLLHAGAGNALPVIMVGPNIANALVNADATVMVGSDIASLYAGTGGTATMQGCVFVGHHLLPKAVGTAGGANNLVMIGFDIMANVVGIGIPQSSVLIGSDVLSRADSNSSLTASVVIGHQAGNAVQFGSSSSNVMIGSGATTFGQGSENVIIGASAAQTAGGSNDDSNNVVVGVNAASTGPLNVVLGAGARSSNAALNVGGVSIGANAGQSLPGTAMNILVIEASTTTGAGPGNTPSALMYGSFLTGNLILGNSIEGTNRDLGGPNALNIVKLLNGVVGTVAPVGGGYFYVTGGALHWVGSGGTDTPIAPA